MLEALMVLIVTALFMLLIIRALRADERARRLRPPPTLFVVPREHADETERRIWGRR